MSFSFGLETDRMALPESPGIIQREVALFVEVGNRDSQGLIPNQLFGNRPTWRAVLSDNQVIQ